MTALDEYERLLEKDRPSAILQFAEQLESMHPFAAARDNGDLYVFRKGDGWRLDGEKTIEDELEKIYPQVNTSTVREVVEKVRRRNYRERKDFIGAIDGKMLHVDNGWLNMDTLTLEPETPERLSVAKLRTPYIESHEARPAEFVRMVMQALPDVEHRKQLLKVMGNLLVPDCRYEKATMLVGEGHNRKSSTLFALGQVLGEENVCSVSLQELSDDRFAPADFYGKMANLAADLDADRIKNTGRFKWLVSGDQIRAQRKHGQPFHFHSTVKMIFSANQIPPSNDQTNAFFRKWCVIPFFRQFERDPTLQERLSTENERAGILKLMLAGRKLLLSEGFDETSIEKIRFLYNQNASLARDFLEQECIIDIRSEDYLTKATALQATYDAYLDDKKGGNSKAAAADRPTLHRQLGRELNRLGVENRLRGTRAKRERYYIGIILKKELEKTQARLTG